MNSLNVKAYQMGGGGSVNEIRRFSLEEDVSSFNKLNLKIKEVFQSTDEQPVYLSWKDNDGDFIGLSSDNELTTAIQSLAPEADCLKVFVRGKPSIDETNHPGVVCDGCDLPLKGFRYKCVVCVDYDLCSSCQQEGKHQEHDMICIRKPQPHARMHMFHIPPFVRRGHCGRKRSCPSHQSKSDEMSGKKSEASTDDSMPPHCQQVIADLASAFGLDPEVASSAMQQFVKDLKGSQPSAHSTQQENAKESDIPEDKMEEDPAPSADEKKSATNPNQETDIPDLPSLLGDAAQQFGVPPEQLKSMAEDFSKMFQGTASGSQPHQFAGMADMMSTLFQGGGCGGSTNGCGGGGGGGEKQEEKETKAQSTNMSPEDFILIDQQEKKNSDEDMSTPTSAVPDTAPNTTDSSTTEKQRFHQRLATALQQMESMGFENEGGWLSQLLISKQLNIGAVLDALNPSSQ